MPAEDARRWLELMWPRLLKRRDTLKAFDNYYCGIHPLPFLTKAHEPKAQNEFRQLLEDSRSNFMQLVVDAVEERLQVDGFRISATSDQQADKASWDIWQANHLDADAPQAFLDALVKGVSYMSVWEGATYPSIAIEDALETIVAYRAGSAYRIRDAALKTWKDEYSGEVRANVYLPEGIWKFRAPGSVEQAETAPYTSAPQNQFDTSSTLGRVAGAVASYAGRIASRDSAWRLLDGDDAFEPNPLGDVVPIVPLRNLPRTLTEGRSELDGPHRIQNQLNGLTFLLAMAGYFGAHRQRWATGFDVEADENGRYPEPFNTAVDRFWWNSDAEAKFGEFEATDLSGYIAAVEQKVVHLAVITRTPRHYLIQQGQSPSGDAIESAESGLVKKVGRRQAWFGEGLEEVMGLARRFGGAQDAPVDSEVIWADPAVETEAVTTDAVIKKFQGGLISRRQAQEDLGYSPQQIARMAGDMAQDQLLAALAGPQSPSPNGEVVELEVPAA